MPDAKFQLSLGDVSAMEARVVVRFDASSAHSDQRVNRITIRGVLRGPFCESARTLPAEFPFHALQAAKRPAAEAVVPDPCFWSPALPHFYRADLEALCDGQVIAEYHGQLGLRTTTPLRVHE
jgi:hypothetical protein